MSATNEYDPIGPWCGYCRAAQPIITAALADRSEVRHVKVEDRPGKLLGRSFAVKLWPTLVFLKDGKELVRSVRPRSEDEIRRGLDAIS